MRGVTDLKLVACVVATILLVGIFREAFRAAAARAFGASADPFGAKVSLNPLRGFSFFSNLILPAVTLYLIGWPLGGPSRSKVYEPSVGPLKVAGIAVASLVGIAAAGAFLAFSCALALAEGWIDDVDRLRSFGYRALTWGVWWAAYDLLIESVPIPPSAGSRVVGLFLPAPIRRLYYKIEPIGGILVLLVVLWAVGFLGRHLSFVGPGYPREFQRGLQYVFDRIDLLADWLGA
jgi:Zn-dependent protease